MQQHENLCRAYFKDVRKSGRTIKEDWPQYWDYARRRGSIYGTVVGLQPNGGGTKRSTASTNEMLHDYEKRNNLAPDEKTGAGRSTSPRPGASPTDGLDQPRSTTPFSLSGRTPTLFNMKRASRAPTVIPRSAAISRTDLIASAERIFFRYLSPAGNTVHSPENHEIYLPPSLRIHSFPLSSAQEPRSQSETALMAQIPDFFHAQKEYCFRAMEQDAFPRFLRAKAFGNLTPMSALVRLIVGLVILWIALAVGFSLIFLDVKPKSKRFFVSAFAFFFLLSLNDTTIDDTCPRTALHTVHNRVLVAYLAPIRTRSSSRIPRPIRDDAIPDAPHTRAVRQEAASWASGLGHCPGCRIRGCIHDVVLGSARASSLSGGYLSAKGNTAWDGMSGMRLADGERKGGMRSCTKKGVFFLHSGPFFILQHGHLPSPPNLHHYIPLLYHYWVQ